MTNRLHFYRNKMAAFEATSDPQRALERGYYVEHSQRSLPDRIAKRLALRPKSTHLLIGGIGVSIAGAARIGTSSTHSEVASIAETEEARSCSLLSLLRRCFTAPLTLRVGWEREYTPSRRRSGR